MKNLKYGTLVITTGDCVFRIVDKQGKGYVVDDPNHPEPRGARLFIWAQSIRAVLVEAE